MVSGGRGHGGQSPAMPGSTKATHSWLLPIPLMSASTREGIVFNKKPDLCSRTSQTVGFSLPALYTPKKEKTRNCEPPDGSPLSIFGTREGLN